MSYFPATIPANTLLYHGRSDAELIDGIDWLSFEIEHAEWFARFNAGLGDPPPRQDPPGSLDYQGYLHTYQTIRPLTKILYLDGLSAAKSVIGPLDSADVVLLHDSDFRSQPGSKEQNRVAALCALSPEIEGIMRMEMGLEIVLCNIRESVEHLSANQRPFEPAYETEKFHLYVGEYVRTINQRDKGIGFGRVSVDYSSMVSAYFHSMNLTNSDPQRPELPRIDAEDKENIEKIKHDVLALFSDGVRHSQSIDWQGVTDMVISRYSDRLAFLTSNHTTDREMLHEIELVLENHINYNSLNLTAAEESCAIHFLLPVATLRTLPDQLIYRAIFTVTQRICRVLFQARKQLTESDDIHNSSAVRLAIQSLMDWLSWSTWSECGKCEDHDVCFIAAWPFGASEDHYHPGCIDVNKIAGRWGYWDYDL